MFSVKVKRGETTMDIQVDGKSSQKDAEDHVKLVMPEVDILPAKPTKAAPKDEK